MIRAFLFLVSFITPATCNAGLMLYGNDNTTDQLIRLDPVTGIGTAIGATGISRIAGIAVGSDGTVYASRARLPWLVVSGFLAFEAWLSITAVSFLDLTMALIRS